MHSQTAPRGRHTPWVARDEVRSGSGQHGAMHSTRGREAGVNRRWPEKGTTRLRPASRLSFQATTRPQRFRSSRTDWNASAYLTRAWMPRKLAHDRASSRIVRSSMLVFVTWDRWASRLASFTSSTSAMSVWQFGEKASAVGTSWKRKFGTYRV